MTKKNRKHKKRKDSKSAPVPMHPADGSAVGLELIAETKIVDLLEDPTRARFEDSGLQYQDKHFHIVLDNSPTLVRIHKNDDQAAPEAELIALHGEGDGYGRKFLARFSGGR